MIRGLLLRSESAQTKAMASTVSRKAKARYDQVFGKSEDSRCTTTFLDVSWFHGFYLWTDSFVLVIFILFEFVYECKLLILKLFLLHYFFSFNSHTTCKLIIKQWFLNIYIILIFDKNVFIVMFWKIIGQIIELLLKLGCI